MDGMMIVGLVVTSFIAGCICMYRHLLPRLEQAVQHSPEQEDKPEQKPTPPLEHGMVFDYIKAADVITHANTLKNQMLSAEDMLTSAELGHTIKASWEHDSTGSYTLTTSKAVALAERRRIRTLLLADIDTLCYKWSTDKLLCGLRCSDRNGAHHELALAHPQTVLPLLCRHKTYGVRPTSTPATPTGHPIGTQGDENTSRSAPAREQAAPADGCHAAE